MVRSELKRENVKKVRWLPYGRKDETMYTAMPLRRVVIAAGPDPGGAGGRAPLEPKDRLEF